MIERRYHMHDIDNYLKRTKRRYVYTGMIMPYTIILLIVISLPLIGMKKERLFHYLYCSLLFILSMLSIPFWDRGIHAYMVGTLLLMSTIVSSINTGFDGDLVFHPRSLAHIVNSMALILEIYCAMRFLASPNDYMILLSIPYIAILAHVGSLGAEEAVSK